MHVLLPLCRNLVSQDQIRGRAVWSVSLLGWHAFAFPTSCHYLFPGTPPVSPLFKPKERFALTSGRLNFSLSSQMAALAKGVCDTPLFISYWGVTGFCELVFSSREQGVSQAHLRHCKPTYCREMLCSTASCLLSSTLCFGMVLYVRIPKGRFGCDKDVATDWWF